MRDYRAEREMIPNNEFRVVESISGRLGLYDLEPGYMEQMARYFGGLICPTPPPELAQ